MVAGHRSLEFGLSLGKWEEDEEGTGAGFPQESGRDKEGSRSCWSLCRVLLAAPHCAMAAPTPRRQVGKARPET